MSKQYKQLSKIVQSDMVVGCSIVGLSIGKIFVENFLSMEAFLVCFGFYHIAKIEENLKLYVIFPQVFMMICIISHVYLILAWCEKLLSFV